VSLGARFPAAVDTVVVGAGTAGAAVAGRLAAGSSERTLLLEAGPDYGPADSGRWPDDLLKPQPRVGDLGGQVLRAVEVGGGEPRGVAGRAALIGCAQLLAQELDCLADLGGRDLQVAARVGVQRFVPGAEQVEEREPVVAGKQFVVPLQEEQHGDRDLPGRAGEGGFPVAGRMAEQAEDGGGDPRLGGC
jgi:choline dehydrogenase-like flavoprotein